ncbi:signal peptide peptidase SppA [Peribacillus kribbensis]|uniref:signal peptide peptidase SppA n=1 Tax=Peribacillus kribbensis TaxID=356658 RepID=UPI0003FAED24|nr:signal peptide peptidase SppA [Peribacillus kribbensis]
MNGKRWVALGIAVALFIMSIVFNLALSYAASDRKSFMEGLFSNSSETHTEEVIDEGDSDQKIVILNVDGVIQDSGESASLLGGSTYNHKAFMDQLKEVKDDDTVKGVIIRVNSPGGGVAESAEIHDALLDIKKEGKKPVYISMGAMAASGGYYISTAADKIFAAPETLTGSLGVIMEGYNYEKLAEKYGVEFVTIKSGEHKDIMSPTRQMTKEEKNIMQSMVNNSFEQFVKVISEGRSMPEEQVKKIADGRVYDGKQAKQLHLIDEYGYLTDTWKSMRKDLKLKDAEVVQYSPDEGFGSLLGVSAKKITGQNDMLGLMKMISTPNSPRLMYLYAE